MRALAAALLLSLCVTAQAQAPAPATAPEASPGAPAEASQPAPFAWPERRRTGPRVSVALAGGYEAARLQGYPASGPTGALVLGLAGPAAPGGARVRLQFYVRGREAETPEGLATHDRRYGLSLGLEQERLGGGIGLEWMEVSVRRAGPGTMDGQDMALRLSLDAVLVQAEWGVLYAELSGAVAGDTRQQTAALTLGFRFDLR